MCTLAAARSPLDIFLPDRAGSQPVRLGPFLVGADGLLRPADPGRAVAFSVRWRGRLVRARLEGEDAGRGAALAIETAIGRVPSTASVGEASMLRERAFALVRALPAHLPPAWRIGLLADHRIGVEARLGLDIPIAASDLVAGVTSFLLGLGAYFDLLKDAGAGFTVPSADAAGTVNTCPG